MNAAMKLAAIFALAAVLLAGCAPVISKEALSRAEKGVRLGEVIKDPAAFTGRTVVLGGAILNIENLEDMTVVEVLEEPLDSRLRPVEAELSEGRFLVEFAGFKDPAVYAPGRLLTIAGTVTGTQERTLGRMSYLFPVVRPIEHHLWRTGREEPSLGIGVGIGIMHGR